MNACAAFRIASGFAYGDPCLPEQPGGLLNSGMSRLHEIHTTGGGIPSALADSIGSQLQSTHACRTADRPNSSAAL